MVTKEIKEAISEVLKLRIDRENFGMLSSCRIAPKHSYLLHQKGITITSKLCTTDEVMQGDKVLAKITYRYAAHKRNGMYKMLKPQVVYL